MTGKTIKTKDYKYTVIRCKNARFELARWRALLHLGRAIITMPDDKTITVLEVMR